MWIKNQQGYELVNLDKAAVLYVGREGNDIMAQVDGRHFMLGSYRTRQHVFDVLDMIFYAMDNSDTFAMPSAEEMQRNIQHRFNVSTSQSHGRS